MTLKVENAPGSTQVKPGFNWFGVVHILGGDERLQGRRYVDSLTVKSDLPISELDAWINKRYRKTEVEAGKTATVTFPNLVPAKEIYIGAQIGERDKKIMESKTKLTVEVSYDDGARDTDTIEIPIES